VGIEPVEDALRAEPRRIAAALAHELPDLTRAAR
jgi:hypothetical protein